MKHLSIGLIKESKTIPDNRTPLIPKQCADLKEKFPGLDIKVESSPFRCFPDEDYRKFGIDVVDDVSSCDLLFGIKEVAIHALIPNKTYCFFSHTIKEQPYNRQLLQAILDKNIKLIDYEAITDANHIRLIGFGKWAGVVGAHYALLMLGKRTKMFHLKKAIDCLNLQELEDQYDAIDFPNKKFVITGGGRVTHGAREIMASAGILEVNKYDFLEMEFDEPVFVNLHSEDLYFHPEYSTFDSHHFYAHPEQYQSNFKPFLSETDVLINCMFWDNKAPKLFSLEDIAEKSFRIETIADVSCDIEGSCPITFRESTIDNPVYGVDRYNRIETKPYQRGVIDVMAVSNLPNELPRDASKDFGKILMEHIIPDYIDNPHADIFERAQITNNAKLTERFLYLTDYLEGR